MVARWKSTGQPRGGSSGRSVRQHDRQGRGRDVSVGRSVPMNRRLEAWLVCLTMAAASGVVGAQQSGGTLPLQRGVSVQMAVSRNAVAVPNADTQDALVVALTADGTAYLRADRLPPSALADAVRSVLSTRNEKTLYIKADARVPYRSEERRVGKEC